LPVARGLDRVQKYSMRTVYGGWALQYRPLAGKNSFHLVIKGLSAW